MKLLSVAIPCYNSESYMEHCINTLLTGGEEVEITVVPGVTAALSGAAMLGAPLMHDFCVISLSDLLTPWDQIAKRLVCAAEGDSVIVLYNPGSKRRRGHLRRACEILLERKHPETVCGWVRNVGREGSEVRILSLQALKETEVDMFTTVFIGSSTTQKIGRWKVMRISDENSSLWRHHGRPPAGGTAGGNGTPGDRQCGHGIGR